MATPRIYWYPKAGGTLETFDWGEDAVNDLQVDQGWDGDGGPTLGGKADDVTLGMYHRVTVSFERFDGAASDRSRERHLRAILNHLRRGGTIALSMDHDKTFGTETTAAPTRGTTSIATAGNLFTAYSASASLAVNDDIVVQSPNPSARCEWRRVATYVTTTVTLPGGGPIMFDHTAGTFLRWHYFWPYLWLPPGARNADLITTERDAAATVRLPLRTLPWEEHDFIDQG